MGKEHQRDEWLHDIDARQRNVVFPDTVDNEARFWRNIGKSPLRTVQKCGVVILAAFFLGSGAFIVWMILRDQNGTTLLAGVAVLIVLIFGPIVGAIMWGTRRTLKNLKKEHHTRKK
jgi:hypothetical protein